MKKFYLLIVSCLMAIGLNAQNFESIGQVTELINSSGNSYFIPKEFTKNNETIIVCHNGKWDSETDITTHYVNFFDRNWVETGSSIVFKDKITETGEEESSFISAAYCTSDLNTHIIYATQTFFNDDEKFEYIVMRNKCYIDIVNEDGEVCHSIKANGDKKYKRCNILKIYDIYYFLCTYVDDNDLISDVYLINKGDDAASISKVTTIRNMNVSPALAQKNSSVNVTLDESAAAEDGELLVTDSNGRIVARKCFEAGQRNVPITTDRMSSGVYNITLLQNGKNVENSRIIVK